jgi:hypothetical protein
MRSKSDFWLNLHKLARDLEREGGTTEERLASVAEVLASLSGPTQQVYCGDVEVALGVLKGLVVHCQDSRRSP